MPVLLLLVIKVCWNWSPSSASPRPILSCGSCLSSRTSCRCRRRFTFCGGRELHSVVTLYTGPGSKQGLMDGDWDLRPRYFIVCLMRILNTILHISVAYWPSEHCLILCSYTLFHFKFGFIGIVWLWQAISAGPGLEMMMRMPGLCAPILTQEAAITVMMDTRHCHNWTNCHNC